ncbi:hypothetical protein V494_07807 [Pseudogymnoascus sp. VKM F-4513 (FW-928)]|nr:hypothetical protein V494_07807 [Pseudogymnoascus sp. VKM F-4513 (FW-928)]
MDTIPPSRQRLFHRSPPTERAREGSDIDDPPRDIEAVPPGQAVLTGALRTTGASADGEEVLLLEGEEAEGAGFGFGFAVEDPRLELRDYVGGVAD